MSVALYEELSKERKEAQAAGAAPDWMITGGYNLWRDRLRYKDETFRDSVDRVASEAAVWAFPLDKERRSISDLTRRFFDIIWDNWLCPATTTLANLGTDRGLPVSCSGNYVGDSVDEFYKAFHEVAMLTKTGHGCSSYLGDIRPRGTPYCNGEGNADGVLPVIQQMVSTITHISQGAARKGATAVYLPVHHGDAVEVMNYHIANPKRLQVGYIYRDEFIERLREGDENAIALHKKCLYTRARTGKGYLVFPDKAIRHAKELGIPFEEDIKASNLCTEIFLPSSPDLTFSCIISSVNAYTFHEWKNDPLFIHDCILFLNAVTDSYISRIKDLPGMEKILRFTEKYRALGLGVVGFCSMLQRNMIPLESLQAMHINKEFFENIYKQARAAGDLYGNATVMAVAPNVSSALVGGGVSQGINPFAGNVFTQETASGDVYRINPDLLNIMKARGIATEEVIKEINDNHGSIQGNPLFTPEEQEVFKTAYEVNQKWLVKLANDRGRWIDQGQSLDLFFPDDASEEWVSEVHKEIILAPYVKSAYYFNTGVGVRVEENACAVCAN